MNTSTKEATIQLANVLIANAANEDLTGEEKEAQVCEVLGDILGFVPGISYIPSKLRAKLLDIGLDKIQEFLAEVDLKAFVKTRYERIKHILGRKCLDSESNVEGV